MCIVHLLFFRYMSHALMFNNMKHANGSLTVTHGWHALQNATLCWLGWWPALLSAIFSCCRPACTAFKCLTSGNAPRQSLSAASAVVDQVGGVGLQSGDGLRAQLSKTGTAVAAVARATCWLYCASDALQQPYAL